MQWEENNVSQRHAKLFANKLTVSVLKKYNSFVSGCKNSEIYFFLGSISIKYIEGGHTSALVCVNVIKVCQC